MLLCVSFSVAFFFPTKRFRWPCIREHLDPCWLVEKGWVPRSQHAFQYTNMLSVEEKLTSCLTEHMF